MKILTVFAHPNPASFCAAVQRFTRGRTDAWHTSKIVSRTAPGHPAAVAP